MATSTSKKTYRTNGFATWSGTTAPSTPPDEESSSVSFLKSWFGGSTSSSSASSTLARAREHKKIRDRELAASGAGMAGAAADGDGKKEHKRIDSLDVGRRLGQCYAESMALDKRRSLGASSGGKSDHSQLSLATQLSLSHSGKTSRSGHRARIDCVNRRMPSCNMYKYDEVTRMVVPPQSQQMAPAEVHRKPGEKHVVIMEEP